MRGKRRERWNGHAPESDSGNAESVGANGEGTCERHVESGRREKRRDVRRGGELRGNNSPTVSKFVVSPPLPRCRRRRCTAPVQCMSTETLLTPEEQADTAVAMPFPPSTHDSASTTSWRPFKNGITSLTIDIPQPRSRAPLPPTGDVPRRRKEVQPQPSRWRSKEFCAYYAVFVVIVPYMAKVVVDLSRGQSPGAGRASSS
jgi:hypothetical protein